MSFETNGYNDPRGPRTAPACRAFLREALAGDHLLGAGREMSGREPGHETRAHLAACAACAARVAARDRLAAALRVRPELPTNTVTAKGRDPLLEAVYERIVDSSAESALGRVLATAPPEPLVGLAAETVWPDGLLASDVARRAAAPPAPVSALAWSRVRESILGGVASQSARRLRRRWVLGLAAASVLAVTGLLLGRGATGEEPTIVFRDLTTMPGVDFAVVRYGATR